MIRNSAIETENERSVGEAAATDTTSIENPGSMPMRWIAQLRSSGTRCLTPPTCEAVLPTPRCHVTVSQTTPAAAFGAIVRRLQRP